MMARPGAAVVAATARATVSPLRLPRPPLPPLLVFPRRLRCLERHRAFSWWLSSLRVFACSSDRLRFLRVRCGKRLTSSGLPPLWRCIRYCCSKKLLRLTWVGREGRHLQTKKNQSDGFTPEREESARWQRAISVTCLGLYRERTGMYRSLLADHVPRRQTEPNLTPALI